MALKMEFKHTVKYCVRFYSELDVNELEDLEITFNDVCVAARVGLQEGVYVSRLYFDLYEMWLELAANITREKNDGYVLVGKYTIHEVSSQTEEREYGSNWDGF